MASLARVGLHLCMRSKRPISPMANRASENLLEREFRANPAYELILIERLSAVEAAALEGLQAGDGCYGILRPRTHLGLTVKLVCKDTALLFDALQVSGRLPNGLVRSLGTKAYRQIVELVLAGVLEVSRQGRFESGAAAYNLIGDRNGSPDVSGRIASLSFEAVKFGQRLLLDDPLRLSAQLYFFNRLPVTPRWQRQLGEQGSVGRFLGTDANGMCSQLLRLSWRLLPDKPLTLGWKCWRRRNHSGQRKYAECDYKIYVSPTLEAVPEALPHVIATFTEKKVRRFKVGAELCGLTRPDKIVGYLDSFQQIEEVAQSLGERLSGLPVQGVPFTADLGYDGLISWGMDPRRRAGLPWQAFASWRLWITNRLACALLDARREPRAGIEPWRFALERLRLEGIDTDSWTPLAAYEQRNNDGSLSA